MSLIGLHYTDKEVILVADTFRLLDHDWVSSQEFQIEKVFPICDGGYNRLVIGLVGQSRFGSILRSNQQRLAQDIGSEWDNPWAVGRGIMRILRESSVEFGVEDEFGADVFDAFVVHPGGVFLLSGDGTVSPLVPSRERLGVHWIGSGADAARAVGELIDVLDEEGIEVNGERWDAIGKMVDCMKSVSRVSRFVSGCRLVRVTKGASGELEWVREKVF